MTPDDYRNFPEAPACGYKGENGCHLTNALFVETSQTPNIPPRFTLGDIPIKREDGTLIPSARFVYVHSKGEHDALKKLVGSFAQWARLRELKWFSDLLRAWQCEWYMKQECEARELLAMHALGKTGSAAAKALFDEARKAGKGAGRPAGKKKAKNNTNEDYELGEDLARVVAIRK